MALHGPQQKPAVKQYYPKMFSLRTGEVKRRQAINPGSPGKKSINFCVCTDVCKDLTSFDHISADHISADVI